MSERQDDPLKGACPLFDAVDTWNIDNITDVFRCLESYIRGNVLFCPYARKRVNENTRAKEGG